MEEDKKTGTQGNKSAEKMLSIVEYMAKYGEPVRLLDISQALNINASTALRFLITLVNKNFVEQDCETLKYYLTYKICAIANKVNMHIDLRAVARPYMKELIVVFGESVCMSLEENMRSVYIEVVKDSSQTLMSMQNVGNPVPMHCTGNGKILLLNYSEDQIDRLIEVRGLTKYTDNTITNKWQLQKELDKIRERGYAYDEEEREIGSRCVAFPIYDDSGKVIAGLSITGPKDRLNDQFIEPRLEVFRKIAMEISRKMGYQMLK